MEIPEESIAEAATGRVDSENQVEDIDPPQDDGDSESPMVIEMRDVNSLSSRRRRLAPRRSIEVPNFGEYVPYVRDAKRTQYEEAALYIQEGIDNDKFVSHPNGVYSKIAFNIVHHPVFNVFELVSCCLLLSLAIIEEPSWIDITAEIKPWIIIVHSVLEMVLLSLVAGSILLRFIWMKPKTFRKQRMTIAAIIMVIMFIEALVVLVRRENHFRVTRCLRPIFFVDSFLMVGVRRVLRQILQSMRQILDVILLLLLMVSVFAFAAYYLFADIDPLYFDTFFKSFLSLFITLTTANHPDVFMEAYVRNRASALFFILYIFVAVFFFMNVLLGVVYATFNELDKMKFRALYLHKREALRLAFSVLTTHGKGVSFYDFLLFMREFRPRMPDQQVMCIFKALQNEFNAAQPEVFLCLEEFYGFYEIENLHWRQIKQDGEAYAWYEDYPKLKPIFKRIHYIERFRGLDYIMTAIVLLNAAYLMIFTIITSYYCGADEAGDAGTTSFRDELLQYCNDNRFVASRYSLIGSFIFNGIYLIEISIRIMALGFYEYFRKKWNIYDSTVLVAGFLFLCLELGFGYEHTAVRLLVIFRPVKLLRIVKLKKRYYKIVTALAYLGERLLSMVLLFFVVFYFYAIIGMEVFRGAVYVGCCENALYGIGAYYSSNLTEHGVSSYWLNNFDNIYQSYVTLYEEMVVNNWFIQMEGFVSETTIYSRFYFVAFWITMTICLSVAIAYIVDAFVFSIEVSAFADKQRCQRHTWFKCSCIKITRKKVVRICFTKDEIQQMKDDVEKVSEEGCCFMNRTIRRLSKFRTVVPLDDNDQIKFVGRGLRTKEYIYLERYKDELKDWEKDQEKKRKELENRRKSRLLTEEEQISQLRKSGNWLYNRTKTVISNVGKFILE